MRITIDTKWVESFSSFDSETRLILYESIIGYLQGNDVSQSPLFLMLKPYLDEEKKRMSKSAERNRINGSKGGRPKKTQQNPQKPKKPTGLLEERSENLKSLDKWMERNTPYIFKNMNPLTQREFDTLCSKYTSRQICDTLEQIENRKDKRKTYTSIYRTLLNWLKNGYYTE